jgi:hypothetical protein
MPSPLANLPLAEQDSLLPAGLFEAMRARRRQLATEIEESKKHIQHLDILNQLFELEGLNVALLSLRPSALRRLLIKRFVTPESVLAGHDIRHGWQRYLLLLLLVDRFRDRARLIFRTLWPEEEWLTARYGAPTTHRQHLWRLLRHWEV